MGLGGVSPLDIGSLIFGGIGTIGQLGMNYESMQQSKLDRERYERMIEQGMTATEGHLGDVRSGLLAGTDKAFGDYSSAMQDYYKIAGDNANVNNWRYLNDLEWSRDQAVGGLQGLLQTGRGILEGSGAAERSDIMSRFGSLAQATSMDQRGRGIGGTTLSPMSQIAVRRGETAEIGGLEDRLRAQKMNLEMSLGRDIVGTQDRYAQQLSGARLGAANEYNEIALGGFRSQADLQRDRTLAAMGIQADYDTQMAGLAMKPVEMWGNFVTQNPIEQMDFSPLINYSGQLAAMGSKWEQQEASRNAASKARTANAWGMGLGAATNVATIGLASNWGQGWGSSGSFYDGGSGFMQPTGDYTTYSNPYALYAR